MRFFFIFVRMSGKSLDKETAIKSILSDLKKGIDKPTITSKIARKCPKTNERTIRRWFESANLKYQEFMRVATPIIEAKEIEALAEVAASGILSKIERQKILTQIALGEIPLTKHIVVNRMIEEVEIVPNWSDRKNAIDLLNKMDGAYLKEEPEDEHEFNGFDIQDV